MHFTSFALAALAGIAQGMPPTSFSQAVDVQVVAVGKNPMNKQAGLKYWPEKIKAEAGTMVQFQFWAGNHTVTQSTFDNPCVPIAVSDPTKKGIFSGFQPAAASEAQGQVPVFTIMVNDTKPMWLYCGQGPHCQKGMVMVINENTGANATRSLENYKEGAGKSSPGGGSPGGSAPGSPSSTPGGNAPVETGAPVPTPSDGSGSAPSTGTGPVPTTTDSVPVPAGASSLGGASSMLLGLGALVAVFF